MKNFILLIWLMVSSGSQLSAQSSLGAFTQNTNPHKVKLFLVNQEIENGILYSIQQDSVLIADYSKKKGTLIIEKIKAFEISRIEMIKTLDPNKTKRGARTGGTIGIIPGALLGIFGIVFESEYDGQATISIPIALGLTAATYGIGVGIGAAIGSNYTEYQIDYSWSKYQGFRNDLVKNAYRYDIQTAPEDSKK